MLHNSLAHISTQTPTGLTVVPRRLPSLVRSCHQPLRRPVVVAAGGPTFANTKLVEKGKGMNWFYELEQEVREYELDQFGVVNNATYHNFCEYGTYKLLDAIGFDPNVKLAIHEVTVRYNSPLKRNDKYLVKLRILDYSTTRLYVEDQIVKLPNHEIVIEATSTLVLLNEKMRPSRIPPSVIIKYNQFLQTHDGN